MRTDIRCRERLINWMGIDHSNAWYKYQYYQPCDKRSDDFGFVHFESKKEFDRYKKETDGRRIQPVL